MHFQAIRTQAMTPTRLFVAFTIILATSLSFATGTTYQPTFQSLSQHKIPAWYKNAKIGIIVHYGLYSVPAYAPVSSKQMEPQLGDNPYYAAWYANSMKIPGSKAATYQQKNYGGLNYYQAFIPRFIQDEKHVDPAKWAALFKSFGAKYVVMVSKHHDGFLLWKPRPPAIGNPYIKAMGLPTYVDLLPKVKNAMDKAGIKFGIYYSGGFDWAWPNKVNKHITITDQKSFIESLHQSSEYSAYIHNQYVNLIDEFHPAVLWNDIAIPSTFPEKQTLAYYYNNVPNGVVNGRWSNNFLSALYLSGDNNDTTQALRALIFHDWFDFYDLEYVSPLKATWKYFEADRALGYSFAYNKNEFKKNSPQKLLSPAELVEYLSDVVSKNGNLLIGIGPKANGDIPKEEVQRLLVLGNWLKKYGDAIYKTRPFWLMPESATLSQIPVRFTLSTDKKTLYAIIWTDKKHHITANQFTLKNLLLPKGASTCLLNGNNCLPISSTSTLNGFSVTLNGHLHLNQSMPFAIALHLNNHQSFETTNKDQTIAAIYHHIKLAMPLIAQSIIQTKSDKPGVILSSIKKQLAQ